MKCEKPPVTDRWHLTIDITNDATVYYIGVFYIPHTTNIICDSLRPPVTDWWYVKYQKMKDAEKYRRDLEKKFGIKCILKKKRRFFNLENYIININLIEDVGEFLVVEGENLKPGIITKKLGTKNPEFITISFDELKKSI